jgi:hypothetical protein
MHDYQAYENLSYHDGPVRAGPDSEIVFLSVIHARARVISKVHVRACMCACARKALRILKNFRF